MKLRGGAWRARLAIAPRLGRIAEPLGLVIGLAGLAGSSAAAQQNVPTCQVKGSREWLAERPSPLDSATIVLAGRTAKVCYSRPRARGRTIFGELVPFGPVWRMGANEPTVLHLPVAASVAGVDLAAGRYLLMAAPFRDRWIVAFFVSDADDPAEMFETMEPVGQGNVPVEATERHVEQLTIRGRAERSGAELVVEWERTRVRIPVRPSGSIPEASVNVSG